MRKYEEYKPELLTLLAGDTLSPKLRGAIVEILKAMDQGDYNLVYELSAVKSYIAGPMQPTEDYQFTETKKTEPSAYSILDGLHHEVAFTLGNIPSGMMVLLSQGIAQKGQAKIQHWVIEEMNKEHNRIVKEAKELWAKFDVKQTTLTSS